MTTRKWAWGVGFAAMIGLGFWMRELASWRPQLVGKVNFRPAEIRFSGDGKWLRVAAGIGRQQIYGWKSGAVDSGEESLRAFERDLSFPRVWFDGKRRIVYFSPSSGRKIALQDTWNPNYDVVQVWGWKPPQGSWSKSRREVYSELNGEIWIWNWDDGKLKKRVRYAENSSEIAIFSPDGKWLIAHVKRADGNGFLRRYDVQTGKIKALINQTTDVRSVGFSPDGRFFWFVQEIPQGDLNIFRTDNWKWQWSANCDGLVKWLPNSRIGIVQKSGFSWRDASGREIRRLPGPSGIVQTSGFSWRVASGSKIRQLPQLFGNISDWVLSPDENWIYSCESNGLIRRWRAR